MKNRLRALMPNFALGWYRKWKKKRVNQQLQQQKSKGAIWLKNDFVTQLKNIGIAEGDVLLVHSSLSKIGYVDGGAQTIIDALLEAVGEKGHLLMPNSPNDSFQLDYIQKNPVFDVLHSPSKLGKITETFRLMPQAMRSESPTEPVSCIGPNAAYFVGTHFGNETPYNQNSPFYKVAKAKGKILYIGVTLDNAGTSLHVLEDLVESFIFPVYYPETFSVQVIDAQGKVKEMKTKVHNPEQSKLRKCDELLPLFESEQAMKRVKFGNAETILFDAYTMLEVMLKAYEKDQVTMYTPNGIK